MAIRQTSLKERKRIDIREPRRYKVIIHNDEVTTMDFVVRVLREVFFMSPEDAETMMMKVHNEGESVVGIYSYDIARSKVSKAMSMAREEKFPLRLTYEPEL
ncbi:ATP-dependent Clp protease adaptor ClpS [Prevotella micans]|nr:ATP-dependent Clp protease adaptor ClpS [Prevotella micans]MBF1436433.1 ATP-dependent Clp protease adaptor ClpS [Prevotella micans]